MNKYTLALIKMLLGFTAVAIAVALIYLISSTDFIAIIAGALVVSVVCYVLGDIVLLIWKQHRPKKAIFRRNKRNW